MKFFIGGLLVAVTLFISSANALTPGPARITLTAKREARVHDVVTYGLYNRQYKGRIGTEANVCGPVSRVWKVCLVFIRTPRGTLVAQGISPNHSRFTTLGVLGGTGIYANTGGTLTIEQTSSRQQEITGQLIAF